MAHHCHATGCKANVPPEMWGCKKHWFAVPKFIRDKIWATYRPGQCDDQNPSREYLLAARAAVIAVAERECIEPDTQLYDFFLDDPAIMDGMKTRSEGKKPAETSKTDVEETSEKLRDELQTPDNPFKFESANAAKHAKLRPDLDQIVETVFVNDMNAVWLRLREGLTVGEKRSDHGTLQKALDLAEKRSHDAHRLYVTAKVERDRWERANDVIHGAMWSDANRSLQKEKEDGLRAKQITDADIKARIATLFPDQYEEQETRRAKIKATVDSLEDLAEQWKSRCRSLQTMLGKLR